MRIRINRKKNNRKYVQLIDDNEFVHHVGPLNLDSICVGYYLMGFNDLLKRRQKIRELLVAHDLEDRTDLVYGYYEQGSNGLEMSIPQLRAIKDQLEARMELLDHYMKELSELPKGEARRISMLKFRYLPDEAKVQLLKKMRSIF